MADSKKERQFTTAKESAVLMARQERAAIEEAVDVFAASIKMRLLQKYEQGKRGWDAGYPSKDLENEILQDAADMRSTESQIRKREELTDIAARCMMLFWRSLSMKLGGGDS